MQKRAGSSEFLKEFSKVDCHPEDYVVDRCPTLRQRRLTSVNFNQYLLVAPTFVIWRKLICSPDRKRIIVGVLVETKYENRDSRFDTRFAYGFALSSYNTDGHDGEMSSFCEEEKQQNPM